MRTMTTSQDARRGHCPSRRVLDYSAIAIIAALVGAAVFRSVYQAAEDEMLALLAPLMLFIVAASFFAGGERRHK
jgi:hypothetical protein